MDGLIPMMARQSFFLFGQPNFQSSQMEPPMTLNYSDSGPGGLHLSPRRKSRQIIYKLNALLKRKWGGRWKEQRNIF